MAGKAARYEFFVTRWSALYDWVTGTVQAARVSADAASAAQQQQAERLGIVLRKAARAKEVLLQLEEYDGRHADLVGRFRPLADSLPELRQALAAEELEGSGGPPQAAAGGQQQQQQQQQQQPPGQSRQQEDQQQRRQQEEDRFGVRAALGGGAPLALAAWRDYVRAVSRASAAADSLLCGPALDQMARFSKERRSLVLELQSLSRQLEPLAQLPPCDPLLRGCAAFDAMAARLAEAQALRAGALARALAGLELGLLECKLRLREGAAYPGSELEAALSHLAAAHAAVKRGDALGQAAWQQVADDLVCVGQAVQRRQQADEGVAASPSRVAQQAFARLARLPRAGGGG